MDKATVVIVEDNATTVRSLEQTINWEQMNCMLVGTANDGESGLALIRAKRPDIVLTDIQMPNMDGLQMIEALRAELPEMTVIILTGYDQFQYASRAIKLSVSDYILKPIRNEEVENALRRALEHRNRMRRGVDAEAEVDKLRARAQLLSLLTNMSHTGQDISRMMDEAGLSSEAYYLIIFQPEDSGTFPQSVLNGMEDHLTANRISASSVVLYDSLVLFVRRENTGVDWMDEAEDICDLISERVPFRMNIGISQLETSKHMVRQTYQQARQALYESAMGAHAGTRVFFSKNGGHNSGLLADMRRRVDELIEKAELTDESADTDAAELVRISGSQYSQLRALVSLYAMLLNKKFPCNQSAAVDKAMRATWFVTNEQQVATGLRQVCAALREGRKNAEGHCSLLTRNVLDYIRIHGADKLSLNDVAERFHVSANYLSALIRKETGITFHEHIINVKMDIAHSMLADPRILVEEVAYAVGYSNYVSFYNVFKQKEGMTPSEYRSKLAQQ